jgi:hypothetical protein
MHSNLGGSQKGFLSVIVCPFRLCLDRRGSVVAQFLALTNVAASTYVATRYSCGHFVATNEVSIGSHHSK